MDSLTPLNNFLRPTEALPSHISHNDYLRLRELPVQHYAQTKLPTKKETYLARRDRLLIDFMWETGGRITDVTNVKKEDVDFSKKILNLKIKKTKIEINLALSDEMIYDLSVFYNDFQKEPFKMTRQNAWHTVKKYGDMINLKLHPHMFRHGLGLHLISQGVDLKMIAFRLGHKDVRTTATYYLKITPEIERLYFMRNNITFR